MSTSGFVFVSSSGFLRPLGLLEFSSGIFLCPADNIGNTSHSPRLSLDVQCNVVLYLY